MAGCPLETRTLQCPERVSDVPMPGERMQRWEGRISRREGKGRRARGEGAHWQVSQSTRLQDLHPIVWCTCSI